MGPVAREGHWKVWLHRLLDLCGRRDEIRREEPKACRSQPGSRWGLFIGGARAQCRAQALAQGPARASGMGFAGASSDAK